MRIGIDISQLAYPGTGVATYLGSLVQNIISLDQGNEYVLFFSSLRKSVKNSKFKIQTFNSNVKIREFKIPPFILDLLWNRLHIAPIEWFVGDVDVFITSDWVEPPTQKAKKGTILYDLIVYKHSQETAEKIVRVQKRKLKWVREESDFAICISESTRQDAHKILNIPLDKLRVVYPGIS